MYVFFLDHVVDVENCYSPPPVIFPQRHRRSIEGLRQEREARLQTCRRARSLSPSKHGSVSSRDPDTSSKISGTPTRRREYLQQLRQEVVETSR